MAEKQLSCQWCKFWRMGIPVGHCVHPDGNFHPTSDIEVFVSASEEYCPLKKEAQQCM